MADGSGEKKQLGKILLKQKLVSPEELEDLLLQQRKLPGARLASTAAQSGKVADIDLLKALSEQHGIPGIDLSQVVIPLSNLKLIPLDIARQHFILPILVKEDRIFLAMADPADRRVIDEIEFVTGRRVSPYVALHDSLCQVIDYAYRIAEQGHDYYVGAFVPADYLESFGLTRPPTSPSLAPPPAEPPSGDGQSQNFAPGHLDSGTWFNPEQSGLLKPPLEDDTSAVTKSKRPTETPTVLIVDDEEDIRRLLKRVMIERGYRVVEAAKGFEALQAVRTYVPSVILLDAMLPEVHGFDICRRIKGTRRYGHIPVIMVSAIYRGWRVAQDLKESYGVEEFLEKPFKIGDVLAAVDRALSGAKQSPAEDPAILSKEAEEALSSGIDAYRGGDVDAAIAHLKRGIGIDPLGFRLHYHLGLLHGRREDFYEAIHELETAVDLQPHNFSALKNLAVLYQRVGFKHKAVEMWERALGAAPDHEIRQGIKDHLMSLL